MRGWSEKCVIEGSKYALWIGLDLSFHLNWVLGPFVHGRLQNLKTSEVTFALVITPLKGGNIAFIAAIARGLFPKSEYRSLE